VYSIYEYCAIPRLACMLPDDLKKERLKRGMTYAEFGTWIAERLTEAAPDAKPVKPYSRQRVYDWEHQVVPVPSRIEAILLREEIARLERLLKHERSPAVGHEITDDEPGSKELAEKRDQLDDAEKGKRRSKSKGREADAGDDW